jgi:hypothetical protein
MDTIAASTASITVDSTVDSTASITVDVAGDLGTATVDRLVAYSLVLPADGSRRDLIWQLAGSVSTLRAHNPDIVVVLFVHGALPEELARVCAVHRVVVHDQGSYEAHLAELCPTGWPALSRNPRLHRFLSLAALAATHPRQVMMCDCDTIFFRDVAELFDRYDDADIVAREEVRTGRTSFGVDSRFIDDPLLARLAAHEGVSTVPPFNIGVVLLNNHVWASLGELQARFVDYAWRFVVGLVVEHASPSPSGGHADLASSGGPADLASSGGHADLAGLVEARLHATDSDVMRALPYPSANRWLLDEVAWWMTLGHIPGLRVADFAPTDVAEHGEFAAALDGDDPWVMCRYDTQHMSQIATWLDDHALTPAL